MPRKNASKYVLLGLIDWEPMSGYDIKKIVEENIRDFWHESYGNIYPTLQKLLDEGLADRRVEKQDGRPDRNVYNITAKGREALLSWLEAPTEERRSRDVFLAKFIFGHNLPLEANIERVERYREGREKRLAWYWEVTGDFRGEAHDNLKSLLEFLALRQGVLMTEARLRWCDEVLEAFQDLAGNQSSEE